VSSLIPCARTQTRWRYTHVLLNELAYMKENKNSWVIE